MKKFCYSCKQYAEHYSAKESCFGGENRGAARVFEAIFSGGASELLGDTIHTCTNCGKKTKA